MWLVNPCKCSHWYGFKNKQKTKLLHYFLPFIRKPSFLPLKMLSCGFFLSAARRTESNKDMKSLLYCSVTVLWLVTWFSSIISKIPGQEMELVWMLIWSLFYNWTKLCTIQQHSCEQVILCVPCSMTDFCALSDYTNCIKSLCSA